MGCADHCFSVCPTPINCGNVQCPKDQLICINDCFNFILDDAQGEVLDIVRGFQVGGVGPIPTAFAGSFCITNEGPSPVVLRIFSSPTADPSLQEDVLIPPESGTLVAANQIFGAELFIPGTTTGVARGQVRFELQRTIKVNC